MAKTRSMTRNNNHDDDDASRMKRFSEGGVAPWSGMGKKQSLTRTKNHDRKSVKTFDKVYSTPWSDLNHDVLFLVMMQLGVIDFVSFSGVCKSWRSLALSNKAGFMASRPPMVMRISPYAYKDACYLIDFEGRKSKTIIPQLVERTYVGSTCGYLILYGSKERDIWLVNLITRHELHFPNVPFDDVSHPKDIRGILVFSPSTPGWVLVVSCRHTHKIWFSVAGKGTWSHVSSVISHIIDLHAFKGKIYTLTCFWKTLRLSELRLSPEPKLTLLKTNNLRESNLLKLDPVSSEENVYLMEYNLIDRDSYILHKLDFDEMKWVSSEKISDDYALFLSDLKPCAVITQKLWADPGSHCGRYAEFEKSGKGRLFTANMWYFPHNCLNINCIDE